MMDVYRTRGGKNVSDAFAIAFTQIAMEPFQAKQRRWTTAR
jgi:hypothetical protein